MTNVKIDIRDDIAVVGWNAEKLLGGPGRIDLGDTVKNVIDRNIKKIILDFSKVKWIDSSGLGILVSAWKIAVSHSAELVVVMKSNRFQNIFRVTNLQELMRTYDSVDEAIKYYNE